MRIYSIFWVSVCIKKWPHNIITKLLIIGLFQYQQIILNRNIRSMLCWEVIKRETILWSGLNVCSVTTSQVPQLTWLRNLTRSTQVNRQMLKSSLLGFCLQIQPKTDKLLFGNWNGCLISYAKKEKDNRSSTTLDHLEQGRFSQSKGHKLPPAPVLKIFSIAKYLQMQQQRCLIAVLHAVILFKDMARAERVLIFPKFLALPQTALSMIYGTNG